MTSKADFRHTSRSWSLTPSGPSTRTIPTLSTKRRLYCTGWLIRKKNFAKVNTREMFNSVDSDGNGKIDLEEWVEFWGNVKKAGHPDDEIIEELNNIKEGNSWCGFEDVNPSKTKD